MIRQFSAERSTISGSTSNLPDSSSAGRPFTSSFSAQSGSAPVFHHSGTIQGLHNIHGNFNLPNVPGSLTSRNSALGGVPANGVQQPSGGLSSGRFTSNSVPVALSQLHVQLSHGGLHGHSGVTSRGGISPILGNAGPRISSSGGNIIGGGNIGRGISAGNGLALPALASRVNLAANNGSGSLNAQGASRLMTGVLQQAPQVIPMIGNSYPTSGGPMAQSQVQAVNNSLSSVGLPNDVNSNESSPFDMNDFPQLSGRPSSAGGPQGQLASLRKQGGGVSSIVQQNQEFSIQNEDFPALPGFKGGNADFTMDLHQKEHHHDNAMPMIQGQHFPMGRSGGFGLTGSYASHRQQQQQQLASPVGSTGASFAPSNSADLLHLHGSELFPSSHGISASYHLQVQTSGTPSMGLRPVNTSITASNLASYDHLIQQYPQHQNQSQFRMQQISALAQPRDQNLKSLHGVQASPDRFALAGLLSIIRSCDVDLQSLALGTDLTTLGLNLNSREDLHRTFGSPWSDQPAKGDPEYSLPQCYIQPAPRLQRGYFSKYHLGTLFYAFYSMPNDEAQLYAADELYRQGWFYHRELRLWFIRVGNAEPVVKTKTYERGSYHCFDPNTWETVRKDNFVISYDMLESRSQIDGIRLG
ncbi:probable NOT transcription complex subunit VIP2 isoform X1 [Amborella trichopoda]|uniref:probable NOT transcription complex subunit VIP2 isoform X1 n=1 Tax=Amborella trichopoda TaxID=13333 RepID=UPI0009C094A2|nr:probable NOT transcription complex subunit VIP2 isoform X1 [Amborella trichopoda]XP_020525672.1 probable NOT transcription complex subunit VIP2 isoform X1 [Amborella trichopoda]|eukprot:XP_020525671.1 probable NOT transcription complex subunit VIP2 isoform X1 [Amborella trichopoda]